MLALGSVAASASAAEAVPPRGDSVLVRVDPDASARDRSAVGHALDADSARALVAGWRVYDLEKPLTLSQARKRLRGVAAAEAVQADAPLHVLETTNDTHFPLQWPLSAIAAPSGWDLAGQAAPVTVAVVDTGVDTSHPDLAGRVWTNPDEIAGNGIDDDGNGYVDDVGGWNFYDWNNQVYNAVDGDSHGTHVAGIIAARRGNGIGIAGVADNARIMPLKFLKPGGGYTSDAIVAIQYAVDEGASVINASWGGTGYSQALCDAIAQAGAAGVTFVAAAGNAGADNDTAPMWPSNCPTSSLIGVAATGTDDGLAAFSNRGATKVDVGAPGVDVLSTIPGGGYGYKSGTSMAAPVVSGIAAALAGAHPGIAPEQVASTIAAGGDAVPALSGATASGRRVDLLGTLTVAAGGTADTTLPTAFGLLSPAPGGATASATPTFRWSAATDGGSGISGYRLTIDGAPAVELGAGATTATLPSPLSDGAHRWSVSAVDGAGNRRSTETRTLLIDRTAPSAPALSSPADGARRKGRVLTLVWTPSTDAVSGVAGYRVLVDGAGVATAGPGATSARVRVAPGRHSFAVVAADAVGNESTSRTRSVLVVDAKAKVSTRARALRVRAPRRVAPGARPRLALKLTRRARVTFTVRSSAKARPLARFVRTARAGSTKVVPPKSFSRPLKEGATYVIVARASGGRKDTARMKVRSKVRAAKGSSGRV